MNENNVTKKKYQRSFSPILKVMFLLIIGIFCLIISFSTFLAIILKEITTSNFNTESIIFIFIVMIVFFLFGVKAIQEAINEYKSQKEQNI
jgi:amino acid transporter